MDRRAKFSEADRKAQFDAAMKVRALFEEESALMDRIQFLRGALAKTGGALSEGDPLKKNVTDFDGKVDGVRKQIVATKEGGAITGEERLREHTDQVYGAILSYEGKPGDYQLAYIEALKRELADATNEFAGLVDLGAGSSRALIARVAGVDLDATAAAGRRVLDGSAEAWTRALDRAAHEAGR